MNNELFQNNYSSLINNLKQTIEQNDTKNFRNLLTNNSYLINKNILNNLIFYCTKDNIFRPVFLSILINFGVEPNTTLENPYKYININMNNKNNIDSQNNDYRIGKSLLMLACEKSNFSLVKDLCESNNKSQKSLDVNKSDKNGRNALYYLRGGKDDSKIIELLVEKGIEVNRKDKDENTPLHYLILNTNKIQLIYDLIEIGGANFMIKNKEGKNSLILINEKFIERNNPNNTNNTINDFENLKPLIKLIKNKLSIKLCPSNKLNDNNSELENNSQLNNSNLIKLSSLSTTSTNTNTNSNSNSNSNSNNENNNIEDNPNYNIFVKFNPLSLIVDTQFNDNNNNISTSKKIDYYTQMNRNKEDFLNMLKDSENKIKENLKNIEKEIKKKKEKVKLLQNDLNNKRIKLNELTTNNNKNLDLLKNDLNDLKMQIIEKKQNLLQEKSQYLFDIKEKSNFLFKYNSMRNLDLKNEQIYEQLKIDLIDFMTYVYNKNNKLESTLHKLNELIQNSVKNCLGEDYQLKMYGSRATKLCLPWSDIDYVISCNITKHFEPLKILNDYLLGIKDKDKFFIDIKYISGASIPVLKIFSNNEYHKISLDISMENPEHHGEECVNYIKQKIKEYEVLTPLTFALKTILQKAFLNDPYKGGLSSYGVILLIIHFLDFQQKKGTDISINNLGKLFYDILYYYGFEYDIANPIIIGENQNMQKIFSIHQFQLMKSELILVDPLNISNNVARNTRQFNNIKLAFKIGYISIKESCECGCHYQYDGINVKEDCCEHNLLNRIFNDVKRDCI